MIYKFIHNPFEGFGKINSSKTYTEDELKESFKSRKDIKTQLGFTTNEDIEFMPLDNIEEKGQHYAICKVKDGKYRPFAYLIDLKDE